MKQCYVTKKNNANNLKDYVTARLPGRSTNG